MTAKIAATLAKPHGLIYVPAGAEKDFLAPLAVEMIPGVGPKTHKTLCSSAASRPSAICLRRPELAARYLDLGEAAEQPSPPRSFHRQRNDLESRLKTSRQMEKMLWELVEEVGGRLRREELFARCLTVKIRYTNFQTITRSRTLPSPTCFDKEIFEAVSDLLRQNISPGQRRAASRASAPARCKVPAGRNRCLNRDQRKSFEQLYKGIDELRRKYGEIHRRRHAAQSRRVDFPAKASYCFAIPTNIMANYESSVSRRLPPRVDLLHAGLAHAPGRPLHGRIPQAARPT